MKHSFLQVRLAVEGEAYSTAFRDSAILIFRT